MAKYGWFDADAGQQAALTALGVATLGADGTLEPDQLPSLRVGAVSSVASQAAMLALPAADDLQFAIRTDLAATYLLAAGDNPAVLANWHLLPHPSLAGLQALTEKDAVSGYAGLDSAGKLKLTEFPVLDGGTP